MNNIFRKLPFFLFLAFASPELHCAERFLAVKGVPAICVTVPGEYSSVELNAAEEFRSCFESVTGSLPPLERIPRKGLFPVRIATLSNPALQLPEKARSAAESIRNDGFLLYADESGLYIVSKIPRGVLYGAYDFFRRFAGARWIFPEKKGEFIDRKPTWSVGDFQIVSNPGFQYREFNLVSSYSCHETMKWMLRNKMQVSVAKMRQQNSYDWNQWGQPLILGGHIFSSLLDDGLFRKHPEYFAMVNGKRIPQKNARRQWQAQPCATNPEGLKIMGDALVKMLRDNPGAERLLILNNDTGGWCECAECAKLGDEDSSANRFWNIANSLAERARAAIPGLLADVHGYQNFQAPPTKITPLEGVGVNICVHHRCYVHSMNDPHCEYNERYREILGAWKEKKVKSLGTYEYTNCLPGWGYLPLERILAEDITFYHRTGFSKYTDEVLPLDGFSRGKPMPETPYRGSILAHYIQAVFLWNPDEDFNSVYEDAISRLYGEAYPAMKKYRNLLRQCYERSNLYLCYGSGGGDLRRILEQPRAEKLLKEYLDEAEKLSRGKGFPAEQVAFERKRFEEVFAKAEKNPETTKSVFSGTASGNIELDGMDTEKDWGYSCWAHDFRLADGTPSKDETWIKFLYGNGSLYLYFEAYGSPTESDSLKVIADGKLLHAAPEGILEGRAWKGRILRTKDCWKGEFACTLSTPVPPHAHLSVGVSRCRAGQISAWNSPGKEAMPANARRVVRGMREWLQNGDFESVTSETKGRRWSSPALSPSLWECSGKNVKLIRGNAASGEYFLRADGGSATIFQTIGSAGQTYRKRMIYPRIRVSADVKGKGRISVSLRLNDRKTNTLPAVAAVNSEEWRRTVFDIDCSRHSSPALYLFLTISDGVSLDNVALEAFTEK